MTRADRHRFGPGVEPDHETLSSSSDWDRIFVVGDVHGCIDELRELFDAVDFGDDDLGIFVGDLVRKGPASGEVLELVDSRTNLYSVRGYNEQKIVDGEATAGLTADDIAGLTTLPLAISIGENLVVHGGVDPRKSMAEQTAEDFLEIRSLAPTGGYDRPFWFERYTGPPRVFFGHTVLEEPYVTEWAVGLDVGCVHGGGLAAYELREGELHTVPSKTYRERGDDEIVSMAGNPRCR